ncbi:MAG: hypothetical protein LAO03_10245 [Acidobacteriia bacterium]|nr:hypothetical protein [Terriglobia bacterium]
MKYNPFHDGFISSAKAQQDLAMAKAMGWEVRYHPPTGGIIMHDGKTPWSEMKAPRETRRMMEAIWNQSITIYKPEVRNA